MLGIEVTKNVLDLKCGDAVLSLRTAQEKITVIAEWLSDQPNVDNVDPLTVAPFGYTADEAYALRLYFQTVEGIRTTNATTFDLGRKMTGLA